MRGCRGEGRMKMKGHLIFTPTSTPIEGEGNFWVSVM